MLVVEDEESVATGVSRCLSAEGFDVDIVHDGAVALSRTAAEQFDLIVLDILLPSMNGYRVCESIRSTRRLDADPHVDGQVRRVRRGRRLRDRGRRLPGQTVLDGRPQRAGAGAAAPAPAPGRMAGGRRPAPRSVAATLPGRFARGRTDRSRNGGARLPSRSRRRARRQDRRSRRRSGVLDFDGDPNIVEVYVGHLRRKLDEPFGRRSIETVRGAGYRLRTDARVDAEPTSRRVRRRRRRRTSLRLRITAGSLGRRDRRPLRSRPAADRADRT